MTREQIERVWEGKLVEKRDSHNTIWDACSRCGHVIDGYCEVPGNFCTECGAAFTGKAVSMIMKRLEALKDS